MRLRPGVRYNLSQFTKRSAMAAKRRVVVRQDDVLVLSNGFEIDVDVLLEITKPNRRVLWTFMQSEDGTRIQPVPFTEDRVIWLTDEDLVRASSDIV